MMPLGHSDTFLILWVQLQNLEQVIFHFEPFFLHLDVKRLAALKFRLFKSFIYWEGREYGYIWDFIYQENLFTLNL